MTAATALATVSNTSGSKLVWGSPACDLEPEPEQLVCAGMLNSLSYRLGTHARFRVMPQRSFSLAVGWVSSLGYCSMRVAWHLQHIVLGT